MGVKFAVAHALRDTWCHKQVVESEPVDLPDTIKASQLHGPKAVLLGDAAHCVTPILGQGANAALEDASVLVDTLTQHAEDLGAAPAAFTAARLQDARALVDLNRYFVWATGLGPAALLAFVPVFVSVAVGSLAGLLPGAKRPAFRDMDKGASYAEIVGAVKRDAVLVPAVLAALVVAAKVVVA